MNVIQEKTIYRVGATFTFLAVAGMLADMLIGIRTGANPNTLTTSVIARFQEMHESPLLGLYHFDFLNVVIQLLLIPVFFGLFHMLRSTQKLAHLAWVLFLVGSVLFISGNVALTMFDLSRAYYDSVNANQNAALVAAGEMLLLKGAHGSWSQFLGFMLPTLGALMMTLIMYSSKLFSKVFCLIGLVGNVLLLLYVLLVTSVPSTKNVVMVMAMPGGILLLIWFGWIGWIFWTSSQKIKNE